MRLDLHEMQSAFAGVGYFGALVVWMFGVIYHTSKWFPGSPFERPWVGVLRLALIWFGGLASFQIVVALAFLRF